MVEWREGEREGMGGAGGGMGARTSLGLRGGVAWHANHGRAAVWVWGWGLWARAATEVSSGRLW